MNMQLHATVHGTVQGVGFRASTTETAQRLGLTGWVRNNTDGTVTCVAQGDRKTLDELVAFLHQGPPAASVSQVDVQWVEPSETFTDFSVRR